MRSLPTLLLTFVLLLMGCEKYELHVLTMPISSEVESIPLAELSGEYSLRRLGEHSGTVVLNSFSLFTFSPTMTIIKSTAKEINVERIKLTKLIRTTDLHPESKPRLFLEYKVRPFTFGKTRYGLLEVFFLKDGLVLIPIGFDMKKLVDERYDFRRLTLENEVMVELDNSDGRMPWKALKRQMRPSTLGHEISFQLQPTGEVAAKNLKAFIARHEFPIVTVDCSTLLEKFDDREELYQANEGKENSSGLREVLP